jgi:hypothetical protein
VKPALQEAHVVAELAAHAAQLAAVQAAAHVRRVFAQLSVGAASLGGACSTATQHAAGSGCLQAGWLPESATPSKTAQALHSLGEHWPL